MPKRTRIESAKERFPKGLVRNFKAYVKEKDVTLVASDGKVQANKLLLKMNSPVIRTMYKEQWKSSRPKEISVTQYDKASVQAFVNYLSTGKVEKAEPVATGLLKMADYFGVEDLKKDVEDFIIDNTTRENAGEVYDLLLEYSPGKVRDFFVKSFPVTKKRNEVFDDFEEAELEFALDDFIVYE